jgi:hypothetical protein
MSEAPEVFDGADSEPGAPGVSKYQLTKRATNWHSDKLTAADPLNLLAAVIG